MKRYKEAIILFTIQLLLYGLLSINYKSTVSADYTIAAITNFTIASLNFYVIQKLSHLKDSFYQWLGYVLGGVAGGYLGIYLSTILL